VKQQISLSGRSVILAGEKVALVSMTEADQPSFQRWLSENADLRSLIDDSRVPSMDDQMRWFARVQQPDRRFFSLVTVPDGVLVGNAGFVDIDPKVSQATLRITIGNPAFLGKGLGSEAVMLLVRYAFSIAAWKRLTLKVLRDNVRAVRTYEKAGFIPSGVQEESGKSILSMELVHDTSDVSSLERGHFSCSVISYVRNGGARFEGCLKSCLPCREHVVLDGGSTDGTAELARKYGCRVLPQDKRFLDTDGRIVDFGGIATQAYRSATEEWVALLAADEELSDAFIQAIARVMTSGEKGAYLVDRFFVIDGRVMRYFSTTHNHQMRFCHRNAVTGFVKRVHEKPVYAPGVMPRVLDGGYLYLPLTETPKELWSKYLRYLPVDAGRLAGMGWWRWLHFAVRRIAVMTMLVMRMFWIRIVHDHRECMPLSYEILNIWYGFEMIKRTCPLYRIRKNILNPRDLSRG
jgi:RimJ/RimL family protein N-acetyltransferase/glycosyltransferase involved in cell wall biosynthesis